MTLDLSTLKPGDTVHFRCGGSAVVDSADQGSDDCIVVTMGGGCTWTNYNDRGFYKDAISHPFDIISVTPKKEPIVGYVNVYPDGIGQTWRDRESAVNYCDYQEPGSVTLEINYDPETKQASVEIVE